MKTTDLRIGNLVNLCFHHKEGWFPATVTRIFTESIDTDTTDTAEDDDKEYYWEGIRLTEDWLIKLGFHKDLGYNIHLGEKLFLRIELPIKGSSRQSCDACLAWDYTGRWFTGHIAYVHQLQNLYHSLTGKELAIKSVCAMCGGTGIIGNGPTSFNPKPCHCTLTISEPTKQ